MIPMKTAWRNLKSSYDRQNSEMAPKMPTPGIYTLYNSLFFNETCEYDKIVTPLFAYITWQWWRSSHISGYVKLYGSLLAD